MKLYLYNMNFFKEIDFEEGKAVTLEIDNISYFSKIIYELKGFECENKEKGLFCEKELQFGKDYAVIIDYYDFETTGKTITQKIIKYVVDYYKGDMIVKEKLAKLSFDINSLVASLIMPFDFSLDFLSSLEMENLFKCVNLSPVQISDNIFEKYLSLINIIGELKLFSLLVFVNFKSFFSEKEALEIIKTAAYKGINILLVENKFYDSSLLNEVRYLIDSDLFERKIG